MPHAEHVVIYHLVLSGCGLVKFPGELANSARAHDLIVIPAGDGHLIGDDLAAAPADLARLVEQKGAAGVPRVSFGGGGDATRMACGYLACDSALFKTLLAALPRLMIINMADGGPRGQWLESSIRFSLEEYADPQAGAGTVLAKLSELMFVEAIRRYVDELEPEQKGWLAGLRDRFVSRALALMHSDPAHAWTVEEVASRIGLSRSALAERFTTIIGQPPMQYLARWRLQLAADLLRSSRGSIMSIAVDVGYESEAAFSRAFRREFGSPPSTWRRNGMATQ
jgi:AraC-like DNA-binding protein